MSLAARVLSMLVRANGEQFADGMRQVRKEVTETKAAVDEANKAGSDGPKEADRETRSWTKSIEEVKGKWSVVKEIVGQVTDVVGNVGKAMSQLSREDHDLSFVQKAEQAVHLLPVIGQAFQAGQNLGDGLRDTISWIARATGATKEYADSWSSAAVKAERVLKAAEELAASTERLKQAQAARIKDEQAVEDLRAEDDFARRRLQIERDYQERAREIRESYRGKDREARIAKDLGIAGERRQLELDKIAEEESKKKAEERAKEEDARLKWAEDDARRRQEEEEAERRRWDEDAQRADRVAKAREDAAKKEAEILKKAAEEQEKLVDQKRREDKEWERMKQDFARKQREEAQKFADLVRGGATTASVGSDEEWKILMRDFGSVDIAKQQLDQQQQIAGSTKTAAELLATLSPVTAGDLDAP